MMHRTPTWRPPPPPHCSGGQPDKNGVSLVHGYSGRRASRAGSSSLLNPAATPSYVGAEGVESAPLMDGAVSAGQTGLTSCDDEKAGRRTRRLGPGRPGSTQREPALHTEISRERVPRAQWVESPFWLGLDASPVAAAGTG